MTEKQGRATSGDSRVALLHLVDMQHLFRVGTPDRRSSHLGHTLPGCVFGFPVRLGFLSGWCRRGVQGASERPAPRSPRLLQPLPPLSLSHRWLRPSAFGKCGTLASSMWIIKDFLPG